MIQTTATSNEHDNFSYLALLRGEIDITSFADSDYIPQVVGRGVSSTTCNRNEITEGSIEKQSNYSALKQSQSCTTMGVTHQNKNNDDANRRREEQSASTEYSEYQTGFSEGNNGNQNAEDNPWDSRIFEDIELVEVKNDKNTGYETDRTHFDHTWNLNRQNGNNSGGEDADSNVANQNIETCDINENDVENFLRNEKDEAEAQKSGISSEFKPEKGMEFKTRDEAQKYLNMYAFAAGFSIAVVSVYRTQSKKRKNEVTRATIKCNKHGHNSENVAESEHVVRERQGTVFVGIDCKVEMVISEKNGIWCITNLKLDHNHPLDPGNRHFRSHVYMRKEEKAIIRTMKQCNIPTRNMVSVLAHLRGGWSSYHTTRGKCAIMGPA